MKRLIPTLGLLCAALVAFAQTPVGVQVPKVTTPYVGAAVQQAKALGYGFVTIEASMPSSPTSLDVSAFRGVCEKAIGSGLRVFVRLHCAVFGSGWGNVATPSYPPASRWAQIRYCRQLYLDALYAVCLAHHIDPSQEMVEDGNELDLGGVSSPCLGSWGVVSPRYTAFKGHWESFKATGFPSYASCKAEFLKLFPAWCWNQGPMAEGTVPAVAAQMLLAIRPANGHGFSEIAYTCEMADASVVGVREVGSLVGPDWDALLTFAPTVDFNCYEDAPGSLSPDLAAAKWGGSKVPVRIKLLLSNPRIKRVGITEANLWASRVPKGGNPAAYRNALVAVAMHLTGVAFVSIFTSVEADAASSGTGLNTVSGTGALVPVGGPVGPGVVK